MAVKRSSGTASKKQKKTTTSGGTKALRPEEEQQQQQRVVEEPTAAASSSSSCTFEELGVDAWLCQQCESLVLRSPTPIQRASIPLILQGRHVMGGAPTGSGKTVAFALPMLQRLSVDMFGVFAVLLTPSRELAYQLADQFVMLGAPLRVRTLLVIGGVSHNDQLQAIVKTRPHILVATPGRLHFLLRTFEAEVLAAMRHVRYLVLDEADRLTTEDLAVDVRAVLQYFPPSPQRQALLFSATLPVHLTRETLSTENVEEPWLPLLVNNPSEVCLVNGCDRGDEESTVALTTSPSSSPVAAEGDAAAPVVFPSTLRNTYLFIPNVVKLPYLVTILRRLGKGHTTIVFLNSCMRVELVHMVLQLLGFPVCRLHSLLRHQQRLDSLALFKSGIASILVATDVASRGLDIPLVSTVLQYDMVKLSSTFVHRVGRTARAGRDGLSVTLITECDVRLVKRVERELGIHLDLWVGDDGVSPVIEEESVVAILDEVSEAKVAAQQQVTERIGGRVANLKHQAEEKRTERREVQQQQQRRASKMEKSSSVKTAKPSSTAAKKKVTKELGSPNIASVAKKGKKVGKSRVG